MAVERLSVADLKEQIGKLSEAVKVEGVSKFNLTKDINADWTLISVSDDGVMREVYGPVGIREISSWMDGVIWMATNQD